MSEAYERYQLRYGVEFIRKLGDGKDGYVLETASRRAVKFFSSHEIFQRELAAYQILRDQQIQEMQGFQIPLLKGSDEELLAIEMTIVRPPFLIDFASAYTEEDVFFFDFSDDVIDEREQHWAEIFGDRWPIVVALRDEFIRRTGLMLLDLSLNNVRFD